MKIVKYDHIFTHQVLQQGDGVKHRKKLDFAEAQRKVVTPTVDA